MAVGFDPKNVPICLWRGLFCVRYRVIVCSIAGYCVFGIGGRDIFIKSPRGEVEILDLFDKFWTF